MCGTTCVYGVSSHASAVLVAHHSYRPYPRCRPQDPCAKNKQGPRESFDDDSSSSSGSGSSSSSGSSSESFDSSSSADLDSGSDSEDGACCDASCRSINRCGPSRLLISTVAVRSICACVDMASNEQPAKKECVENCDAEVDNSNKVLGPVFSSQPLGDLENRGLKSVKGTQTKANGLDEFIVVPQSVNDVAHCSRFISTPPPLISVIHGASHMHSPGSVYMLW